MPAVVGAWAIAPGASKEATIKTATRNRRLAISIPRTSMKIVNDCWQPAITALTQVNPPAIV
jgi:hypothetical protein